VSGFCRYDLRTTDPDEARRFYSEAIGLVIEGAPLLHPTAPLAAWRLHEQARARGAPPHWLGQIAVPDVEAVMRRLIGRGSEPLGPILQAADGSPFATLRDPFGAVFAVRANGADPETTPGAQAVWHQLHTRDADRSWQLYSELFGWSHTGTLDLTDPEGGYRLFGWDGTGQSAGSIGNTARSEGVHPHWMFCFPVPAADLEQCLARVRAQGGRVLRSPAALPTGERVAPCEDPQGAAFGVIARPAPSR
jgi:predicted enzyme related to lactoylglutathione lyase